jgi:uncharacterized protein (TIGR03435 family)
VSAQEGASFEAASAKVAAPNSPADPGGPGTSSPGQCHFNGARLMILTMHAYRVQGYQVVSKSNLNRDRFDVVAKAPAGATRDQFRALLRNLPAVRFLVEKTNRGRRLLREWPRLIMCS